MASAGSVSAALPIDDGPWMHDLSSFLRRLAHVPWQRKGDWIDARNEMHDREYSVHVFLSRWGRSFCLGCDHACEAMDEGRFTAGSRRLRSESRAAGQFCESRDPDAESRPGRSSNARLANNALSKRPPILYFRPTNRKPMARRPVFRWGGNNMPSRFFRIATRRKRSPCVARIDQRQAVRRGSEGAV